MTVKNRWLLLTIVALVGTLFEGRQLQCADPKADAATVVVAEGLGKDEKEAKKAAFRDAVSKVVGTLIDAQTLIKNDEVISERILEFSGGFIKNYDVIKTEKTDGGLIRIRIKATVERLQIVTKLQDAKVTTQEVKGTDLLAEKMTKEEARKNATELMVQLHEELPKLMQAEVLGKPRLNAKNDAVLVNLSLSVDQKRYSEFIKKAVPLLDKVGIEKSTLLLSGSPFTESNGKKGGPPAPPVPGMMAYGANVAKIFAKPDLGETTPNGWALWILTSIDGRFEKARWNIYWIDADITKCLAPLMGKPRLNLVMSDEKMETVVEDEVELKFDFQRGLTDGKNFPKLNTLWNYQFLIEERTYRVENKFRT